MMLHRATALAGALLMLAAVAGPAAGGEPDPGHADQYPHQIGDPRRVLDFHFSNLNYPAWFRTGVEADLETNWDSLAANNSNVPQYSNGGNNTGGGTIFYTAKAASPCTGNPEWLGCNPASGRIDFAIYVRSLPSASKPTWLWWDRDTTCNDVHADDGFRTSVCFSLRRVVAHESTHNTLTRSHNTLADDESIMQSNTPTPNGSPDNWKRPNFLPCDEAGAQLEYGLADPAGNYADCFDVVPGDGAKGLNTTLTITSGTTYMRCVGSGVGVRGRLALSSSTAYEDMRATPLAGRAVRIDRKRADSSTWTIGAYRPTATGASGDNWSILMSSDLGGLWDYRARFYSPTTEPALNSSGEISWTVSWTSKGCPLSASRSR
jgi:hypothetical protein